MNGLPALTILLYPWKSSIKITLVHCSVIAWTLTAVSLPVQPVFKLFLAFALGRPPAPPSLRGAPVLWWWAAPTAWRQCPALPSPRMMKVNSCWLINFDILFVYASVLFMMSDLFFSTRFLQLRWLCQTFGGSGFAATAPGANTHLPKTRLVLGVSVTSWRHQTSRGFPVEGRFPNQPLSQLCLLSSPQVHLRVK